MSGCTLQRFAMGVFVTVACFSTVTVVHAEQGMDAVKTYMVEHATRMLENSKKLSNAAERYYQASKTFRFDYGALWQKDRPNVVGWVSEMKKAWLSAHNNYEEVEGIVAGIPTLAQYDLILDAGNPGSESEDVAPYNITLPDGTVLERPGNLFHNLLEPALWGTKKESVALEVDLDGNGKVELGEVMPKADLLFAFAKAHTEWTQKMLDDIKAWQPNENDLFTAMVTMVPTVGDYFGEWKESKYVTGAIPMFVAQSRLVDVKGIMHSTKVMYFEAASALVQKIDPVLDKQIRGDFLELLSFIDDVYMQEQAGVRFKPEQVDALGSEAQEIADRIAARLTQAASKLKVKLAI